MQYIYSIKSISARGWFTLLALMLTICLYAQESSVKGVVVDETNTPLIGATVQVKGTSAGTVTDIDGNFTLKTKKGNTLVISYIGYKTQEVKYTGQPSVSIKMTPDNQSLDEVVVVGYGAMKRSDLTGSVASVAVKDIEGFQSSSIAGALGGQVAGVQITSTDGTPGAGFSINIRGVGTLTGDSSPLYIVDGFEVESIDHLSNSDIESIEILKDASSSAIYGARAANGVVLITTKSGKVGRPVVSYNGSASYRNISKKLDVLSPYEFVKLQGEVNEQYLSSYYKEGVDDDGNPYRYQSLDDYIGDKGVDWQDQTFNATWSQDHNISVTGGNNDTKYTASFSRYIENGIFKNSGFDKTTAKVRFNQKMTKNLTLDATISYAQTNRKGVGTSADSGRFNMLAQILSARPTGGLKLTDEALLDLYKKLRPGEPPTVESSLTHLNNLFFDAKRYDLCRFGRYKYNKKLGIASRLAGHTLSRPVINEMTGELLFDAGTTLTYEQAEQIQEAQRKASGAVKYPEVEKKPTLKIGRASCRERV